jgi:uncharacterized repeat protein (TIGR03809 family)
MATEPAYALDLPATARRWCALAEQRRDAFVSLYESGRWRHYYDEGEFIARMRDVVKAAERWRALAGPPPVADSEPLRRAS